MTALVVNVRGAEAAAAHMGRIESGMREVFLPVVTRETAELQRHIVEDKLSGQVLRVRSGTGRRSIAMSVFENEGSVIGRVGTNLRYMLAHEYGMTIQIPAIRPVKAKSLHWVTRSGVSVFAMRARAHAIVLPERSFLRTGLQDMREHFVAAVRAALAAMLRRS